MKKGARRHFYDIALSDVTNFNENPNDGHSNPKDGHSPGSGSFDVEIAFLAKITHIIHLCSERNLFSWILIG